MSDKQKPNQVDLNHKLDRHFLSCSAFVGAAVALVGTQDSQAAIVYSGIQNLVVPSYNGAGGIYLDLNNGAFYNARTNGNGTFPLPPSVDGWDINMYARNNAAARDIQAGYSASTYFVYKNFSSTATVSNRVDKLGFGDTIDASSPVTQTVRMIRDGIGPWNNTTGFMGVQFLNGATPVYGWVRLQVGGGEIDGDADPFNNGGRGFPAMIIDWAWEDSGGAITAGAGAVPEPGSIALGCLAAGAVGLRAWRKRKNA